MTKKTKPHKDDTKNLTAACPNPGTATHTHTKPSKAMLSHSQVRTALAKLDISPGSPLRRCAQYFALTSEMDADDLLQEALLRAMTTRSSPAALGIEPFIKGVMRSIASGVIARHNHNAAVLRTGSIVGLFGQSQSPTNPADVLDQCERAAVCAASLVSMSCGDPSIEKVLDGIGQGLCGKNLMAFADVTELQLATVRRTLKRRSITEYAALHRFDDAA